MSDLKHIKNIALEQQRRRKEAMRESDSIVNGNLPSSKEILFLSYAYQSGIEQYCLDLIKELESK